MKYKLDSNNLIFYCPGCKEWHAINTTWTIIEGERGLTVKPSILINSPSYKHYVSHYPTCHMFITEGQIQYLNDCSHDLAGKIVPMEDFEE